jgi:environmental stress-induced protein Ves
MNFIALDSVDRTAWANGGGFKRNLLKTPTLQISVADITQDGPFSYLPDQQRFFAVLKGAGVWLGTPELRLTADSGVVEFNGESAPACRLIDGPTEDLNTMLQRSSTYGRMNKHRVDPAGHATNFRAGEGVLAVYVDGPAVVTALDVSSTSLYAEGAGLFWQLASSSPKQWQIKPASANKSLTIFTIEGLAK